MMRTKPAVILLVVSCVVLGILSLSFAQQTRKDLLAIDPSSPTFLWEYLGYRGVVREDVGEIVFYADGLQAWAAADGRRYTWNPESLTVVGNTPTVSYTLRFDTSGRLVEQVGVGSYSYVVDDRGNTVRTLLTGYSSETNTYDLRGFLIRTHRVSNFSGTTSQAFENDEWGNITLFSDVSEDGTLTPKFRFDYVYDAQGNWIEARMYSWVPALGRYSADPQVFRRSILYY